MAALRTLLATLVAATGLVLAAPAPAFACSCVSAGPATFVKWADLVVVGEVTEITPPPERELMSSSDPATYAVAVDRVLAGRAGATVKVRSAVSGASCGLERIKVGREYVFFATRHDIEGAPTRALWASLCGGTAPASPSYVAEVEAVTGEGVQPGPDEPAATGVADPPDTGNLSGDQPSSADPAVPAWAWGGGALVVVLAAGLLVLRARRRA